MRLPSLAGENVKVMVMRRRGSEPSALCTHAEPLMSLARTPHRKRSAFLRFSQDQLWSPPNVEVGNKTQNNSPPMDCSCLGVGGVSKPSGVVQAQWEALWPGPRVLRRSRPNQSHIFHKHLQCPLPGIDAHGKESPEPQKARNELPRSFGMHDLCHGLRPKSRETGSVHTCTC